MQTAILFWISLYCIRHLVYHFQKIEYSPETSADTSVKQSIRISQISLRDLRNPAEWFPNSNGEIAHAARAMRRVKSDGQIDLYL